MNQAITQLPALTSLRFFAASLVVLFHYLPRTANADTWWLRVINHGYVGVSFFFVLSGFILAYTGLHRDFRAKEHRQAFYIRRIARVSPAYFVALLLHWPLFAWYQHSVLTPVDAGLRIVTVTGATIAMIQPWFPWLLGQLNAPSWTIGVEMFLYATLPWLLNALRSVSKRRQCEWLLVGLAVCWIPALAQPLTAHWFTPSNVLPSWLITQFDPAATWISCFPPFHFAQFLIGAIAGNWVAEKGWRQWAPGVEFSLVIGALGCMLVPIIQQRGSFPLFDSAINHGALAGPFALLFVVMAIAPNAHWLRPLTWAPLVKLGDASYALYIFQMPVMAWTGLALKKLNCANAPLLVFTVGFAVLLTVSLAFQRFEKLVRPQLIKRLMHWWGWFARDTRTM